MDDIEPILLPLPLLLSSSLSPSFSPSAHERRALLLEGPHWSGEWSSTDSWRHLELKRTSARANHEWREKERTERDIAIIDLAKEPIL